MKGGGGIHIYSKQQVKEVIELVIIGNVQDRWEAEDVEKYFKQKFFSWWFALWRRFGFLKDRFYFLGKGKTTRRLRSTEYKKLFWFFIHVPI